MIEEMSAKPKNGRSEVVPLTAIVDRAIASQPHPEMQKDNLRYILIDAEDYLTASLRADPIGQIVHYAKQALSAGKQVIVFNINDLGDQNLRIRVSG